MSNNELLDSILIPLAELFEMRPPGGSGIRIGCRSEISGLPQVLDRIRLRSSKLVE
jgi:hypothetical protein